MEATIEEVDPNDIESISILKDAAAAVYGSRAEMELLLLKRKEVSNHILNEKVLPTYCSYNFIMLQDK